MVTWSLEALLLALYVIAIICASFISFATIRQSSKWGAFIFVTFGAFLPLRTVYRCQEIRVAPRGMVVVDPSGATG